MTNKLCSGNQFANKTFVNKPSWHNREFPVKLHRHVTKKQTRKLHF